MGNSSQKYIDVSPVEWANGIVGLPIKNPDPVTGGDLRSNTLTRPAEQNGTWDGELKPHYVPNDPYVSSQWHITSLLGLTKVWDDYLGTGVSFLVIDDGFESNHEDLVGNYVSDHFSGYDPATGDGGSQHGTAVGGIIAAVGNNNQGVTGVSPESSVTGMDFLGDIQNVGANEMVAAFGYGENFDVTNNSWGSYPFMYWDQSLSNEASFDYLASASAMTQTASGRNGKGTIILKAAGNDDLNAAGEGLNNSPYIITIAAMEDSGDASSYSNWGSSILVAGPAASHTTDLMGDAGYATSSANFIADNNGNYTDDFNGTSAATPAVSGVVGLMLEANPKLGWRDVQNILAESAAMTGSYFGEDQINDEHGSWQSNSATNWNGGGYSFHQSYGYGAVDAFAAVRMAEVWTDMKKTSAVSTNLKTDVASANLTQPVSIVENGTITIPISAGSENAVQIEEILVELDIEYPYPQDLVISLIDPDGQSYVVWDGGGSFLYYSTLDAGEPTTFKMSHARGFTSDGAWTLEVTDTYEDDNVTGKIHSANLTFLGAAPSNATIHTITEDYNEFKYIEGERSTITDIDGGKGDWINAVAIPDDSTIDLDAQLFTSDTISATLSGIEHAASGDGNDNLKGSNLKNKMNAGRGDDVLSGLGGKDFLFGLVGNDELYGGDRGDKLYAGQGTDVLEGGTGRDKFFLGKDTDVDTVIIQDASHSVTGKADIIYHFKSGVDILDLSGIDANENVSSDDAFNFSGQTSASYSIWTQSSGKDTILYGDTDGLAGHELELLIRKQDIAEADIIL